MSSRLRSMSISSWSVKRSPSRPDVSMQVCSPSSLQRRKIRSHERPLHHRLAAGERDAALADLEHLRVLADLLHRARDGHRVAVVLVPGIRVVTVLAAQQATGEKADEAQAGSVHRAADLVRVHVADEVVFLLDLLDVAGMHRVVVVRRLALRRALARDVELVAAAGAQARLMRPPPTCAPWKVRLMTSSCCSFVSLTKFTA